MILVICKRAYYFKKQCTKQKEVEKLDEDIPKSNVSLYSIFQKACHMQYQSLKILQENIEFHSQVCFGKSAQVTLCVIKHVYEKL